MKRKNRDANDILREDGADALRQVIDAGGIALNGGTPQRTRFLLTRFNAVLMSSSAAYLIKGLIPRAGLTVIWGPPKCGKSFWTFDFVMHIVLGEPYRGRRVQQGAVVYLALEGGEGFRYRIEAFRRKHGTTDAPFYLITDRTDLVRDHAALIGAIRAQLGVTLPALVVIDTLNRSLAGSKSKDEDMTAYIQATDAIREAFGCAVIIVHHCGVAGDRPRGHTSLTGAADAQIAVTRDGAGNIIATLEWLKDGPEGDVIASRLEQLELGADEDGDSITSCVIIPVDGDAIRPTPPRKLSDRQRLALDALAECAASTGQEPPNGSGLPASIRTVALGDWRDQLYRSGVLDREAASPREDFRRLRNALQARKLVGATETLVWRMTDTRTPQPRQEAPGALRPIAVIRDYDGIRSAIRLRAEQIGISRLELDERAEIASGESGRLLSRRAKKQIGPKTLHRFLDATGLAFIAVADDELIEAIEREIRAANACDDASATKRPPHWRLGKGRAWGRRLAALRAIKLTPAQRSASARIAARARWSRPAAAPPKATPAVETVASTENATPLAAADGSAEPPTT
jgi:hypothetical protein